MKFYLGPAQILMLCLLMTSLGVDLERHGRVIERKVNVLVTLLGIAITLTLLYWGGFFTKLP